jgi:hypothetical protein
MESRNTVRTVRRTRMFSAALMAMAALTLAFARCARATTVTITADSGAGSLRQTILDLNATGPGTITFR